MAQPRFQLRVVRRRPVQGKDERRLIADARPTGRDDRIVWRLLSANNRELGRSGEQYLSVEPCLAAIDQLRVAMAGPEPVRPHLASSQERGVVWWWSVPFGGEVLACAVRAFSRQIECRKNYASFAGSAVTAAVLTESVSRRSLPPSLSVSRRGVS